MAVPAPCSHTQTHTHTHTHTHKHTNTQNCFGNTVLRLEEKSVLYSAGCLFVEFYLEALANFITLNCIFYYTLGRSAVKTQCLFYYHANYFNKRVSMAPVG